MKLKTIQITGSIFTLCFAAFVIFIYVTAPTRISEIPDRAASTLEKAVSSGRVLTGTYTVDQQKFAEALAAFRQERYAAARDLFAVADPERRDAAVQFYIAYSFYRQGWGRVSSDDELFKQGLVALERVTELDPAFKTSDPDLKLATAGDLRTELQAGMKFSADDLNPARLWRERK